MAATDVGNALGLIELAKRTNSSSLLAIADPLAKKNDAMNDSVWLSANNPGFHKHTRAVSLPTGTWRGVNTGVSATAAQTKQITEVIGRYEAFNDIDEMEVDMAPDGMAFRAGEDGLFVEGMGQGFMTGFLYNDKTTNDALFSGLATRSEYNLTSADNVVGASGTGSDTTSIWIIEWGAGGVFFAYPMSAPEQAVRKKDLGLINIADSSTTNLMKWRTQFVIQAGLVIRDDRAVQRIANIESAGSSNIFDPDLLYGAFSRLPNKGEGAVIYANRTIWGQMLSDANSKTNAFYMGSDVYHDRMIPYFAGVPVHMLEAITITETAIS